VRSISARHRQTKSCWLIFYPYSSCLRPAFAQDEVNFRCDFPIGPRSLGIWGSNPTADAKACTVVCTARLPAEPEFNFTVICTNAPLRALANDLMLCSRDDVDYDLFNPVIIESGCR
jgi:hypothetical protein